MEPYYESWKTSSHADIACVDCHIPPGITAELRKKYEAVSMVARYFTGTYGTNPWAEVDDAACLECHERRLLKGKVLFGQVLFDHGPHLTELRRGKRLRCTSCHSQIVQGSHITVTQTTCTLCHFKGQASNQGTASCTLCHQVPTAVAAGDDLDFDHADVERFGMECVSCHTPPPSTSGSVPRERCLSCHNEPERLERFAEGEMLHETHVTDHKVECTHCHLEIEHVVPRHMEATRTECSTCHGGGHSPQRDLYAGIGGKGIEPMPDSMFLAGIRCEGCHLDHGDGNARTAGEISCMSCHGPAYRNVFATWSKALAQRTRGLRGQVDESRGRIRDGTSSTLADAEANLGLVERGHGIHNYRYSLALLDAAHEQMNAARAEAGLRRLSTPWPAASYESGCLDCHAGVETQSGEAFGLSFGHRPHVVSAGLECGSCHRSHEEREESGQGPLHIDAADCLACHHGGKKACDSCHADLLEKAFETDLGDFSHELHAGDMEISCSECHGDGPRFVSPDLEVCSDCH
jgi:nitrate/TMAO reductase-like tetraheme cytochrome c subunit